jgi:hypothetical protein
MHWLAQNWPMILTLLLLLLPTLITGLTQYPQAAGAVKVLQVVLGLLSVVPHANSPGSLKLPMWPSKVPVDTAGNPVPPTAPKDAP